MRILKTFFEMKPDDVRAAIADRDDWSSFTALIGQTVLAVEIGDGFVNLELCHTDCISVDEPEELDGRHETDRHGLLSHAVSGPLAALREERLPIARLLLSPDRLPGNEAEARRLVFDLCDISAGARARKREAIVRMLVTRAARHVGCNMDHVIAICPRHSGCNMSDFFIRHGMSHIMVYKHDGLEVISDLVRNLRLGSPLNGENTARLLRSIDIHAIRDMTGLTGHERLSMEDEARRYAEEEDIDFFGLTERLADFLSSRIDSSEMQPPQT